jgi:hypothetical protein
MRRSQVLWAACACTWLAAFAVACGDGGVAPGDVDAGKDVKETIDAGQEEVKDLAPDEAACVGCDEEVEPDVEDVEAGDIEPDGEVPLECPCPGCLNCICETNDDCLVFCVPTAEGGRCTQGCQAEEDCPGGWSCKMILNTKGDPIYVCVTSGINYCMPCEENKDCASIEANSTNRCVSYGSMGKFCGVGCGAKGDPPCPEGSSCQEATVVGGATSKQCVPDSGECACSKVAKDAGASTTCFVYDPAVKATCFGKRECLPTGLTDCDAQTPSEEKCDGIDNDCDLEIDPEGAKGCVTYYADNDLDGYGIGVGHCWCKDPGQGYSTKSGDCNDSSLAMFPGAPETCNGLDDDCDKIVDNENADGCRPFLYDNDGDGWASQANAGTTKCLCAPDYDSKFTAEPHAEWDCDDTRPDVFPGAKEYCDGLDNDCDGVTDPEGSGQTEPYYYDEDGDGFGLGSKYKLLCAPAEPFNTKKAGDCNDQDPNVNPLAAEQCNGKDDNCNGLTDEEDAVVMCPPKPGIELHGTVGCAGKCTITNCDAPTTTPEGAYVPGWYDVDASFQNGCECQADTWEQMDGHSCGTAVNLSAVYGDFPDNGFKQVIAGNLSPADDEDWYLVNATDPTWAGEPDGDHFNVTVRFTQNPNKTFLVDIYRGSCAETNNVCKGGVTTEWATNFLAGYGEKPCSTAKDTICNSPADVNRCLEVEGTAERCGSCPGEAAFGANSCSDNSAKFYIRVYRDSGKATTCLPYEIEIANGLYPYVGQ